MFSREQLSKFKKKRIRVNAFMGSVQCKSCGMEWSPNLKSGGEFPRFYWLCPHNRCNEDLLKK